MIFIDEKTVESLITWDGTIEATQEALKCASSGCAVNGERVFTPIFATGKWMAPMPGYLDHKKFGAWACKMLINSPQNANGETPLPVFNATIYYMDMNTGILKAVMGGTAITNYRTAAASIIATKYLSPEISQSTGKILTILGAGEQGKAHAEAFYHCFKFLEIRIWNRSPQRARALVNFLNKKYAKNIFKFFENNEAAVRGADVIATTTNPGVVPILKFEWVKQGAHINAVGVSSSNSARELDADIYRHADVYTDCRKIALKSQGILSDPAVQFKGEIGEVILGKVDAPVPGRTSIFQSFGIPVQDCAMARMVFDAYNKKNSPQK